MRVLIERENLYNAMKTILVSASMRQAVLPNGGLVISAMEEGAVTLVGFSPKLTLQVKVQNHANVTDPGELVVAPAEPLLRIIEQLPNGQLELKSAENVVQIQAERGRYNVRAFQGGELPKVGEERTAVAEMPSEIFRKAVRKVIPAASKSAPSQLVLEGVHIRVANGALILEATDQVRVAKVRVAGVSVIPGQSMDVVLPADALAEAVRAMPQEGRLQLEHDGQNVILRATASEQQILAYVRSLEGGYPVLDRVFEWSFPVVFQTEREGLLGICERTALLSTRGTVSLRFVIQRNKLEIHAAKPEVGIASEELDGTGTLPDGTDEEVRAFNGILLLDGLRGLDGGEVLFEIGADFGPLRLRGTTENEMDYQYLLMPLRETEMERSRALADQADENYHEKKQDENKVGALSPN